MVFWRGIAWDEEYSRLCISSRWRRYFLCTSRIFIPGFSQSPVDMCLPSLCLQPPNLTYHTPQRLNFKTSSKTSHNTAMSENTGNDAVQLTRWIAENEYLEKQIIRKHSLPLHSRVLDCLLNCPVCRKHQRDCPRGSFSNSAIGNRNDRRSSWLGYPSCQAQSSSRSPTRSYKAWLDRQ